MRSRERPCSRRGSLPLRRCAPSAGRSVHGDARSPLGSFPPRGRCRSPAALLPHAPDLSCGCGQSLHAPPHRSRMQSGRPHGYSASRHPRAEPRAAPVLPPPHAHIPLPRRARLHAAESPAAAPAYPPHRPSSLAFLRCLFDERTQNPFSHALPYGAARPKIVRKRAAGCQRYCLLSTANERRPEVYADILWQNEAAPLKT